MHLRAEANRSGCGFSEEAGSLDIREQAGMRVKKILSSHYPDYIDPTIDKKIREKYSIQIPREFMQAGNERC